jgi:4-amino-4-deoxy-L-arabinose transferase-like glycosyltransferase
VTPEASGKASLQSDRSSFKWLSSHSLHLFFLLIVIAAGLWLRTMNIRWGLPDTHPYLNRTMDALHPDEQVLVQQAAELQEKGVFHITSLRYPPIHAQLTAILGKLSGAGNTPERFLLARGISVAAGLGSLLLIYFLGLRWNRRTALIAVAFLSVSMVAVREAHWANPEPLSAFWVLLACLILLYLEKNSSPLLFVLLGAAIALGVASKYFAALFLHLPVLAAFMTAPQPANGSTGLGSIWQRLRRTAGRIMLSYISFGIVIFLTLGIYVIKDPGIFLQAYETHAPWAAHNGLYGIFPKPVSVPTYIGAILPIALGIPLFVSGMIGIALSVFRRKRANLILIGCILPFWLFLEFIQYHPLRFCLSLAPMLCLPAAIFFDHGMSHRSRLLSSLIAVGLLATLLYSGIYGYGFINVMTPQNDTRLLATEWLEEHGAKMEQVALLGVDTKSNSLGFINYDGMDRVSGDAYPVLSAPPEYIVVLENVGHILRQYERLTHSGYHYSAEDWYPMVKPSPETLNLFSNLSNEAEYRRVREFKANPHLGIVKFNYEALKFDLALTNLDISVYRLHGPAQSENQ